MRVRFESESGACVNDPTADELDVLLAHLDGVDDSYASLTTLDGRGYVQVGGGPTAFTVEVREIRPDGTFRHLKAVRLGDGDSAERRLTIGGANVLVRADQILDFSTTREVLHAFLRGRTAAGPVAWSDMTAMFEGAT